MVSQSRAKQCIPPEIEFEQACYESPLKPKYNNGTEPIKARISDFNLERVVYDTRNHHWIVYEDEKSYPVRTKFYTKRKKDCLQIQFIDFPIPKNFCQDPKKYSDLLNAGAIIWNIPDGLLLKGDRRTLPPRSQYLMYAEFIAFIEGNIRKRAHRIGVNLTGKEIYNLARGVLEEMLESGK